MTLPVHVRQRGPMDCGIAALAMVTGDPYEDVLAAFGDRTPKHGLSTAHLDHYLVERGWWVARKYSKSLGQERDQWPPVPFAPAHIATVTVGKNGHFVVMDATGSVLDPAKDGRHHLTDYDAVANVTGVLPPQEAA